MAISSAEKVVTTEDAAAGEASITDKPVDKRRALGRGLDSLLPAAGPRVVTREVVPGAASSPGDYSIVVPEIQAVRAAPVDEVAQVRLDQIDSNPYQSRMRFEKEPLDELADSIRANGVMQPIVVRPGKEGRYMLILGERRCRASKLAGKETIPAIIRRVSEQQAAEMTVVENLQREDLNCLEQASAFAALSRDFELTQEQIGKRVGVSRESVSNYMRLLKLPPLVMQYLRTGELGFSEGIVLLQLMDESVVEKIADEAVRKHLSVVQLEDLVDQTNVPPLKPDQPGRARWVDPNVRAAQNELQKILGVKVKIRDRKGRGKIVIEYSTVDDYERVVEMLRGK